MTSRHLRDVAHQSNGTMLEDRNQSRVGLLTLSKAELEEIISKELISEEYDVDDTVFARGKFANVRKATHKITGVHYAAKYIKKRRRAVDQTPEIHHEIAVLMKCADNSRVVRLHQVYETNSDVVLMLELAAGGELQQILDQDEIPTELEARRAMKQVLEGLSHLHERNIAHLDLKPQNILLSVENVCDDIKLCDFGVSRVLEPGTKVQAILGTVDYVSPEILSYEPITLAADIWSIGVLGYVLLSGVTPFGADDKQETYLNISQGDVTFEDVHFSDISSAAIDFIKCTLVVDPRKRPTVQQLLQHPWITPKLHLKTPVIREEPIVNVPITPKTTPVSQRKSMPALTSDTPIASRKSYDSYDGNAPPTPTAVRSFVANCMCAQCGTTCRHMQAPVAKTPITVDRGILC